MKHIKLYEEFVNESLVNEGWKSSLVGLLALGSIISGVNHLNHSAERKLKTGEPIEMSIKHSVFSDRPVTKNTYTLKVNNLQKEYVEVDNNTKTITINTDDISNIELKMAVRDKIKDIDPNAATQSIKNIRIY